MDNPRLAAHVDDLLHRTCHLARSLTGAEQAALKVDLDGDGIAARKFFNLSERYDAYRGYRVDPRGLGLHGIVLEPGQVMRLTQAEVEAHPAWSGFGSQAAQHPPMRGWLATPVCSEEGIRPSYGLPPALRQGRGSRLHGRGRRPPGRAGRVRRRRARRAAPRRQALK